MDDHLQAPAHGTDCLTDWIGPRTAMDTVMMKRKVHTFKDDRTSVQVPYSPQSIIPKARFPSNITPISALNPVQQFRLLSSGYGDGFSQERSDRSGKLSTEII
jgi:hypothetical protein